MNNYVEFLEINDWEGESWSFFIPLEGNEHQLDLLETYLVDQENVKFDFPYSLGGIPIPEFEVDILVKHSDVGYMPRYNKLSGKLDANSLLEQLEQFELGDMMKFPLYKGGIKSFMKEDTNEQY
jgi:hypothetical protein